MVTFLLTAQLSYISLARGDLVQLMEASGTQGPHRSRRRQDYIPMNVLLCIFCNFRVVHMPEEISYTEANKRHQQMQSLEPPEFSQKGL